MPPSPLQPPTLRADLPVYPQLDQTLRVTATTVAGPAGVAQTAGSSVLAGIYYVAFTQQRRTDSGLLRDREPCLVQDVNGVGLTPGFYSGRLAGSHTSLPVYDVTVEPADANDTSICRMLRLLPGYNGAVVQILGHDSGGTCRWYNVAECP